MEKKVVYGIFVVLIVLGIFITLKFGPSMTTGSVVQQEICVSPQEADNLIENYGCYENVDSECDFDLVAVKCP